MNDFTLPLILDLDVVSLTMSLVNIESATGDETGLADSIESALAPLAHLAVERIGDTVVARGRGTGGGGAVGRVLVAGHIDTVAGEPDALARVEMGKLFGAGACDAKGGIAVMLRAAVASYDREVTFVFYSGADSTDGDAPDGLAMLAAARPELLAADVALLVEPTNGGAWTAEPGLPAAVALAGLTESGPAAPPACAGADSLALLGIPVIAFGPGDPALAHADRAESEFVPTAQLTQCEYVLRTWLQG